jgi:hypothetical protein
MDQIDQKLYSILSSKINKLNFMSPLFFLDSLNSLNSLNKSVKVKRPPLGAKQNSTIQPASTTAQTKNKRTSGRK